ncbi:SusD/RagB family nutrient-binding outer membrane lipoprotein [Pedobacter gandavensis]|uniref:SusD/RagB family nutrient-binding outer membrane lipoprotein n=1 Tax=Pedobacter gandavensis TaxID=2679963 RepID=A0ABR6F058_9SPHI|nr:SusD/RagB family nutrient-binding outer membrane lipoprotein [Pedobacter gandavensis]MBB2150601.1 SusD/RagB family nutrient-binding outer membrane lipoprotein [Pedobacter gandavensis]
MKKQLLLSLAFLLSIHFSCSKAELDKIDTDPTKSTEENFDPNYLLSAAQLRFANKGYYQLLYPSTMMQLLASTYYYYNNGDKYINVANFTDYQGRVFDEGYAEASGIREMQRLAKDKDPVQYTNLVAIGDLMFVLFLQRITDMYGDVPYQDAGKGRLGIKYPVYDRQEEIYSAMLSDIELAIKQLNPELPSPTADLFYKGDLKKWRKFGYSLMLRVAMRLSKVDPEKARLWTEKAAAGGTFADISDNAFISMDASNYSSQNGISLALRTLSDYREVRWSKTLIDQLKRTNDPRLSVIAEIPAAGFANNNNQNLAGNSNPELQRGLPNGYDLSGGKTDIQFAPEYPGGTGNENDFAPLGKYSRPRTAVYLKLGGPIFILTYAETELLLSEAALRGWAVNGTAATHYQNGLKGALQATAQLDPLANIPTVDIDSYLKAQPLDESTKEKALEMINTQYWISTGTMFNFIEAWFNWKRSGYPVLKPINYPGNVTNGSIPRRMIYLSTEILNNTENYKAAVARLPGGDVLSSRVWWDQ